MYFPVITGLKRENQVRQACITCHKKFIIPLRSEPSYPPFPVEREDVSCQPNSDPGPKEDREVSVHANYRGAI